MHSWGVGVRSTTHISTVKENNEKNVGRKNPFQYLHKMFFTYFYFKINKSRDREHRLPADLCGTLPPPPPPSPPPLSMGMLSGTIEVLTRFQRFFNNFDQRYLPVYPQISAIYRDFFVLE